MNRKATANTAVVFFMNVIHQITWRSVFRDSLAFQRSQIARELAHMRVGAYRISGPFWLKLTTLASGTPELLGTGVTRSRRTFSSIYHHYEWLVSSVTANYGYSDFLGSKKNLTSFRCTTAARLSRNLTIGITYSVGDILRDLDHAQELAIFSTIKF